jgi:uncharacterized protein YdeI (YjbR/CyaY-like superfamily)
VNPLVDDFIEKAKAWKAEYTAMRAILQDCGLVEELKWEQPCYTFEGKNIVLIHGFKEYCAVLFPKGVLLKDEHQVLIIQTENVQAARQIRFTNVDQIVGMTDILKAYVRESVENELTGKKVAYRKTEDFPVPEELWKRFDDDPAFQEAFYALTPGRQLAYLLHFSQAKQAQTREARINKSVSRIFEGKGLLD